MRFLRTCTSLITGINAILQARQQSARSSISAPQQDGRATDGSKIIDKTVLVNGLKLRFKVSAPVSTIITDGKSATTSEERLGLNVLLHGDGGASFETMPNQNVQGNLMGVVILAPNDALLWGGQSTRQVERPDGVVHATAIDRLIRENLPDVVAFDPSNVWFTGVSGGSLLLSGFFVPMFMSRYKTGAMFLCGGMSPPTSRVSSTLDSDTVATMRLHWQSSQQELASLKTQIPAAIKYYEALGRRNGMDGAQFDLQTGDATPTGGHCAFDNRGFNSGIQLAVNSWTMVMAVRSGNGVMKNVGIAKPVVGRENLFN